MSERKYTVAIANGTGSDSSSDEAHEQHSDATASHCFGLSRVSDRMRTLQQTQIQQQKWTKRESETVFDAVAE